MFITDTIKYVGVNDRITDLFEGQYVIPKGISYNSYIIYDEKIAVVDSVDIRFADEWLENISKELGNKSPDYLIVQHMEPDHSSSIMNFINRYPSARIVSSSKSFTMMKQFFGNDFFSNQLVVGEGDTLSLGEHTLTFITAPMVHWPEVIVTYCDKDNILFSADAFGKFGALDTSDDWACEARRYYIGIVGKYGAQVQSLLKKVASYDIQIICPLHGPVLCENIEYYINLYDIWSSYKTESDGVVIAYTSIYGNTKKAVIYLKEKLEERNVKVVLKDLARCDMSKAVEDAFQYGKIILATTTYNNDIFPFMREFINHLTERNFQNKKMGFIENGSWAPVAGKIMKQMLEKSKNITYANTEVKILSAVNETNKAELNELALEFCE